MAMSVSPGKSDAVAAEAPGVMGLRDAVLVEHDGAVTARAVLHQMASDPHRPADPALLFRLTVHGQDTVAISHDLSLLPQPVRDHLKKIFSKAIDLTAGSGVVVSGWPGRR